MVGLLCQPGWAPTPRRVGKRGPGVSATCPRVSSAFTWVALSKAGRPPPWAWGPPGPRGPHRAGTRLPARGGRLPPSEGGLSPQRPLFPVPHMHTHTRTHVHATQTAHSTCTRIHTRPHAHTTRAAHATCTHTHTLHTPHTHTPHTRTLPAHTHHTRPTARASRPGLSPPLPGRGSVPRARQCAQSRPRLAPLAPRGPFRRCRGAWEPESGLWRVAWAGTGLITHHSPPAVEPALTVMRTHCVRTHTPLTHTTHTHTSCSCPFSREP